MYTPQLKLNLSSYRSVEWDYIGFRFCTGVWIGIILLILVATDASAFVCFITRFTEENFATLIAFIFIKKSFDKVAHIGDYYPIDPSPCFCFNDASDESLQEISESPTFTKLVYNGTKKHYYPCEVCIIDWWNLHLWDTEIRYNTSQTTKPNV